MKFDHNIPNRKGLGSQHFCTLTSGISLPEMVQKQMENLRKKSVHKYLLYNLEPLTNNFIQCRLLCHFFTHNSYVNCFIDSFNCKRDASSVLMEYCPESCI